jgi:hypothetical protein
VEAEKARRRKLGPQLNPNLEATLRTEKSETQNPRRITSSSGLRISNLGHRVLIQCSSHRRRGLENSNNFVAYLEKRERLLDTFDIAMMRHDMKLHEWRIEGNRREAELKGKNTDRQHVDRTAWLFTAAPTHGFHTIPQLKSCPGLYR